MKEVVEFLYANPAGCLATVDDGGRPQVRPWRFMFEQEGKLWFCTANTKAVFYQLHCNPAIQFCSISSDFVTARISGDVIFGLDIDIKKKILAENELLRSTYKKPENEEFEIFYLKHGTATLSDLQGKLNKKVEF